MCKQCFAFSVLECLVAVNVCGSSLRCRELFCIVRLWYFLIIFNYFLIVQSKFKTCFLLSTECSKGTFGYNCSSPCHCLDDTQCNHVNGSCPDDLCAPGWRSNNCSLGKHARVFSSPVSLVH